MTNDTHQWSAPTTEIRIEIGHSCIGGTYSAIASPIGLIVVVSTYTADNYAIKELLHYCQTSGFSTVTIDLLSHQESHFRDIHRNIPLLSKRLLMFLDIIKKNRDEGKWPTLPIGIFATKATAPSVLRVAALRDHAISAIVCQGGELDLAGRVYLQSLHSPLLILQEEGECLLQERNLRTLQELSCIKQQSLIPDLGFEPELSVGLPILFEKTLNWFHQFLSVTKKPPTQ